MGIEGLNFKRGKKLEDKTPEEEGRFRTITEEIATRAKGANEKVREKIKTTCLKQLERDDIEGMDIDTSLANLKSSFYALLLKPFEGWSTDDIHELYRTIYGEDIDVSKPLENFLESRSNIQEEEKIGMFGIVLKGPIYTSEYIVCVYDRDIIPEGPTGYVFSLFPTQKEAREMFENTKEIVRDSKRKDLLELADDLEEKATEITTGAQVVREGWADEGRW